MKHKRLIEQIAESVQEAGGRALLVGGCVRDELMGTLVKDIDIEVYGLEPIQLKTVLEKFGKVDEVGASFQVFKLMNDFDISIPRREKKVGVGHKGFEVTGDPFMSYEEACSRRDFTINAIMKDPLTGELIDPFNGVKHIKEKVLRMVSSNTFKEDSLRVLRLAQFASRFQFDIDFLTCEFARGTDLSDLPKERVWMEIEKLLMKSPDPSLGVGYLVNLDIAKKIFPQVRLSEIFEGSHVMAALRQSPHFCNDLSYGEKLTVLTTLFCYGSNERGLDQLGLNSVEGYPVRKKVEALLENINTSLYTDYDYYKLSQKVHMKLLSRVIYSFSTARKFAEKFADTIERLGIEDEPMKPLVTGKYLIEYGMNPSPEMGETLDYLYDMQMHGLVDSALFTLARNMCAIERN